MAAKDLTLTPTGAIKGNEMISDLEDTALDQERILPSSCFASSSVSLSGCLATEIKMRISSVHLWKSSSSCYVPISRYPILSSVRPVHAQPETDEEITEYVLLSDYRAPESFPAFTFAIASGYVYRSNALDLSVPNPKCSIQCRRALPAPRLFGQFSADAGSPSGRTLGPVVVNNASSSDAIWELERELQLRLSLSSHHRVKCLRPPLDPLIFHQNVR